MSKRTSTASKAIRLAWEKERDLVNKGQGTRDWTEEQQHDILEKGKAYDDSGKAFEGHHMQNAEKYPEYQGDPDNIQFLTRKEHYAAHKYNWKTPTNGYYNYVMDCTRDFGEEKFVPCEIINLTNPVLLLEEKDSKESIKQFKKQQSTNNKAKEKQTESFSTAPSKETKKSTIRNSQIRDRKEGNLNCLFAKIVKSKPVRFAINFAINNKEVVIAGGAAIGAAIGTAIVSVKSASKRKSDDYSQFDKTDFDAEDEDSTLFEENKDICYEEENSCEHASGTPKCPHKRREHISHRWKKNESGVLEPQEVLIKETCIHKEQMDDNN